MFVNYLFSFFPPTKNGDDDPQVKFLLYFYPPRILSMKWIWPKKIMLLTLCHVRVLSFDHRDPMGGSPLSPREVLFHWACEKIRAARGSAQTDEQLCQTILEKFQRCPGIGSWDFRNGSALGSAWMIMAKDFS